MNALDLVQSQNQAVFLLGASGNLGNVLAQKFNSREVIDFRPLEYKVFFDGSKLIRDEVDVLKKELSRYEKSIFVIATGATSKLDEALAYKSNFLFPSLLIDAVINQDVKFVTLGSVNEYSRIENSYLDSKRSLSKWIDEKGYTNYVYRFKLHTVYGGHRADSEMFISQVVKSLKYRQTFNMSSGLQIRKYHHVQDIAQKIYLDIFSKKPGQFVLESGEYIKLVDLAKKIFAEFSAEDLLIIDEEDYLPNEVYTKVVPLCEVEYFDSRPLFPAILDWVEKLSYETTN